MQTHSKKYQPYYTALRALNEAEDRLRSKALALLDCLVDNVLDIDGGDKAEYVEVRKARDAAYEAFQKASKEVDA